MQWLGRFLLTKLMQWKLSFFRDKRVFDTVSKFRKTKQLFSKLSLVIYGYFNNIHKNQIEIFPLIPISPRLVCENLFPS